MGCMSSRIGIKFDDDRDTKLMSKSLKQSSSSSSSESNTCVLLESQDGREKFKTKEVVSGNSRDQKDVKVEDNQKRMFMKTSSHGINPNSNSDCSCNNSNHNRGSSSSSSSSNCGMAIKSGKTTLSSCSSEYFDGTDQFSENDHVMATSEVNNIHLEKNDERKNGNGGVKNLEIRRRFSSFIHGGLIKGRPKTNQDFCMILENFCDEKNTLIGIFDGHGHYGHLVASYALLNLPTILLELFKIRSVNDALKSSFILTHKYISQSLINTELSGTTGTIAYIQNDNMSIAWVGDSKAVIALVNENNVLEARDLTLDHRPWMSREIQRINKYGGVVAKSRDINGKKVGPYRIWCKSAWYPGLAVSRAIGDDIAHRLGVTEIPDILNIKIEANMKFAIFASDGVWEFVSSQEAVDIVSNSKSLDIGSKNLADEALKRWVNEENGSSDDISVILLKIA